MCSAPRCKSNLIGLTIIGVINSAVGAYYYLRIIVLMYMRESRKPVPVTPVPFGLGVALAISVIATLYLGLVPDQILRYARQSAQELLPAQAAVASVATAPTPPPEPVSGH